MWLVHGLPHNRCGLKFHFQLNTSTAEMEEMIGFSLTCKKKKKKDFNPSF